MAKTTITPALSIACQRQGIKLVSESTVDRIIHDLKARGRIPGSRKISINGRSGKLMVKDRRRPIKKMRRKGFYPEQPGEPVEIDRYRLFLCRRPQALSAEPHRGIGKLPPLRYYLDNFVAPQKSDMLWTLRFFSKVVGIAH